MYTPTKTIFYKYQWRFDDFLFRFTTFFYIGQKTLFVHNVNISLFLHNENFTQIFIDLSIEWKNLLFEIPYLKPYVIKTKQLPHWEIIEIKLITESASLNF